MLKLYKGSLVHSYFPVKLRSCPIFSNEEMASCIPNIALYLNGIETICPVFPKKRKAETLHSIKYFCVFVCQGQV